MPGTLEDSKKHLDRAIGYMESENYELCLFKASKAKAEADLILNLIGVTPDLIDSVIDTKLKIARKTIVRNSEKDMFPILGYSYYEYANSLRDSDLYLTLLFSQYALELGNMDIYFKEKNKVFITPFESRIIITFILGIIFGSSLVLLYFIRKKRLLKERKKRILARRKKKK